MADFANIKTAQLNIFFFYFQKNKRKEGNINKQSANPTRIVLFPLGNIHIPHPFLFFQHHLCIRLAQLNSTQFGK